MPKRTIFSLFAFAVAASGAGPVIGTVAVTPTFAPANTPTQVTITAVITDPTLVANGANVQRLNSAGNPTAVLGILHDDGLNGDQVAGDHIFTLVFTLNEPNPSRIFFRTTAAFQGILQRVPSSSLAVDIANSANPLSIAATAAPAPNAAGWNNSDVTVTFACAGGAGGSDSCPGIVRVTTEGSAQTIQGTTTDGSGNNATTSLTVNLDKTAPVLNITSPANGAVVSTPVITVTGTVTDALSGVATFTCNGQTASLTGSAFSCNLSLVPGTNAITVQATDVAGNTATSNLKVTYSVSTLAISAAPSPAPNAAGWNNTDVTLAFSCSGGLAPVVCPPSVVISNEGGNQVISRTATDAAGSTATASVTLKIDKTAPTLIIGSPASAATVTTPQIAVTGTATDALSGVAKVTCNGVAAVLTGPSFSCNLTLAAGTNTIAVQATDVAGNTASSNLSVTLGTALTISATASPAPNAAGWNNSNVTVTFTCAGGVGTVTCPQPVVVSTDGASQAISRTATDGAGNTATVSVTLKIDKTPPVVAISSPASGTTVTTPQITLTGTATDALSGIASVTCNGSPAALTQSGLSCNLTLIAGLNTIIVQATDIAGNPTAISIPVTLSTSKLTISASSSPSPNTAGWNNTDVTVTFTCSGGTGAVTCPQPVVVSTEGANQTISRTATDGAGNSATASVTLRIDKTAPTVAISFPTPGATVTTSPITVTGTVTDALSGIAQATCNGLPATIAQSSLSCNVSLAAGLNTIVVQTTDVAGNATSISIPVTFSSTGPTITASIAPPPNAAGWNDSNVTVSFTCAGGTPPLTCPAPVVVSTETAGQVVSGTVTDSAARKATASVTIKLDKTPPSFTSLSPAIGSTVTAATQTITGTVIEALSGIASVSCNGTPASVTASAFTCSVSLSPGSNSISLSATDIAGNTGASTLTLTYAPIPTVTLTSPANLSFLNITPTTVNGTVSDPTATVTVNGLAAPVSNGSFSIALPLAEGPNIITATATTPAGAAGTASIQVTLDTTPPHVTITSPPDQFVTTASSISVAGTVNDIVVGTVNSQQAQVTVDGIASQVANRTFLATNVPLTLGSNTIQAVAVDRAGNSATTQITVTRQAPQPGQIQLISGNNQTATIGTAVGAPLVVALTDSSGNPAANKPVIFTVTQNNGMLSVGGGTPAATAMATTNAQGQATATWTLGMRSGAGSDSVQAYSVGFPGTAVFTATATQAAPGLIVVDSGNNQTGAVNQALPKPLIAVVVDAGHNRLAGIPVTFTMKQGGGSFGGQTTITVNTDSDGRAAATLTLGFQEGSSNNLVTADFSGDLGFAASFTASGLVPGNPSATEISGLVLDNSNRPIPGVTIRAVLTNLLNSNSGSVQASATVQTDSNGRFTIYKAPVGFVKLLVDGSTATAPGAFPTLDYDMVTVAGQINTVGQPIYLLAIKTNNQLCVTATTGGGTLTIPEAPGFSLTFGPGQVTFPGGSKTGCVSVTVVHPDKVPMVPGFGQQPRFIVTIQPSGALFNPPAPITLPNVDGLTPREVTEMYSFDHDIGSFVAIGTGTVSDDGQVIRSNAGVGVLKAGWHCGGNSSTAGAAATCGPCAFCDGQNCQPNPVQGNNCVNPCIVGGTGKCANGYCTGQVNVGAPCGGGGTCDQNGNCVFPCVGPNCTCTGPNCGGCPNCNSGNPCIDDSCVNSQCVATPNQLCQNACTGKPPGASCNVGGLTGVCDSTGNCNLCTSVGAGASCYCAGAGIGTCNSAGQCNCPQTCSGAPDGTACTDARFCTSFDGVSLGADACFSGTCRGAAVADQSVGSLTIPFNFSNIATAFFTTLFGEAELVTAGIVQTSPTLGADLSLKLVETCCETKQSLVPGLQIDFKGKGGLEAKITAASTSTWLRNLINSKVSDPIDRQTILDYFDTVNLNLTASSSLSGGISASANLCTLSPHFDLSDFTLAGELSGSVSLPAPSPTLKSVGWTFSLKYSCDADALSFFNLIQLASLDLPSLVPTLTSLLSSGLPTFHNCKYEGINAGFGIEMQNGHKYSGTYTTSADGKTFDFNIF